MSGIAETIARKQGAHRNVITADMGLFGKRRPEGGGMDDDEDDGRPVNPEKVARCRQILEDYLRAEGLAWGPGCMDRVQAFVAGNEGDRAAVQDCLEQLQALLRPRRDDLPKDVRKCLRRLRRVLNR
jgi:hypothetical protein